MPGRAAPTCRPARTLEAARSTPPPPPFPPTEAGTIRSSAQRTGTHRSPSPVGASRWPWCPLRTLPRLVTPRGTTGASAAQPWRGAGVVPTRRFAACCAAARRVGRGGWKRDSRVGRDRGGGQVKQWRWGRRPRGAGYPWMRRARHSPLNGLSVGMEGAWRERMAGRGGGEKAPRDVEEGGGGEIGLPTEGGERHAGGRRAGHGWQTAQVLAH